MPDSTDSHYTQVANLSRSGRTLQSYQYWRNGIPTINSEFIRKSLGNPSRLYSLKVSHLNMFARSSPASLFPVYLLPSIPFRRRKESTDSTISTDSNPSTTDNYVGNYLSGHTSHLRCAKCSTDVCLTSQIISKGFTGRHGRAYLVSPFPALTGSTQVSQAAIDMCLPNTKTDAPSSRQLVTGVHTVSDVRCAFCNSMLGWKYDGAEEESQRYKVGKYILETKMIYSSSNWESHELELPPSALQLKEGIDASSRNPVHFDSQDEDECEDLFAGVVRVFGVRVPSIEPNDKPRDMSWKYSLFRCVSRLAIPPQNSKTDFSIIISGAQPWRQKEGRASRSEG